MNKLLELNYISLTHIVPTYGNSKSHDIGLLIESITAYGFRVPIVVQDIIDYEHLDDHYKEMEDAGEKIYALLSGNGRCAALSMIQGMVNRGEMGLPMGLVIQDGIISVPATMGDGLDTIEEFESFVIDDNNLVVMGGDFTPLDVARMYDVDGYLTMLTRNIDTVKSVDGDDLDMLLKLHQDNAPPEFDEDEPELPTETQKTIMTKIIFENDIDKQDFDTRLKEMIEEYPSNTTGAYVLLDIMGLT